jgi:hypothetical protein
MGYYGLIVAIDLNFNERSNINKCLEELEELDVSDPLRDNLEETWYDKETTQITILNEYFLKLGDEKEYLPIIAKYAYGFIEIHGDENPDFRKYECYGNGEWTEKTGRVIYD